MTPRLVDQIVDIASHLERSGLPWALGGALALAYATEEPRGTRDIDVNVFVPVEDVRRVLDALPAGVEHTLRDEADLVADGQARLWWDGTPVDIFLAVDPFHHEAAARRQAVPFGGTTVHVLAPEDLAVFKAMFDRGKDWVDIQTMVDAGTLVPDAAAHHLARLLGDDPRVDRLRSLRPST